MARSEEDTVNWLDCVSAIETEEGFVYFCDNEYFNQKRNIEISDEIPNDWKDLPVEDMPKVAACSISGSFDTEVCEFESNFVLRPIGDFESRFRLGHFLYSITGYNPMNNEQDVVDNLTCNDRLLAELKLLFPDCKILNNFSYFPRRPHHFEKGFTILIPLDYPLNHERIIHNLAVKYCQAAYFKCRLETDRNEQTLVILEDGLKEVKEKLVIVERLSYHPAYLHRRNNSVFHSFNDAVRILSKCHHIPEVEHLLKLVRRYTTEMSRDGGAKSTYPLIAVEGLNGIGIAQLSRKLSKAIIAKHLESPPKCIQPLRKTFEAQNQLIRGAFYTIGNYILAAQIKKEIRKHPVVLDRYWSSTAAFTISSEVGCGTSNLPPKGHFVYNWPDDLPKATATVLVSSKRDIRDPQNSDKAKRNAKKMIYEVFRRMKNPSWIEVDKVKQKCSSNNALTIAIINRLQDQKVITFNSENNKGSMDIGFCPGTKLHFVPEHDRFMDYILAENQNKKLQRQNSSLAVWGSEIPALILH